MNIRMTVYSAMVFFLWGCSNVEVDKLPQITNDNSNIASVTTDEKPPTIIFSVGEVVIKTYNGTYTWHYLDKNTGQDVAINADHAPPTEIVDIEQGIKVDLSKTVNLQFAKEPTSYELRVWNSTKVIATYNSFEDIKEQGKYIVEIVGTWGKSTATYVVALNITNL